ncbi:lipocalin-like domain-containing protein [Spirosoma arcticum]
MKKLISARSLAYALVVVMPFWFSSCKKGDSDVVTPNSIEGDWRISGYKIDPGIDLLGTGQKNTDLLALFRSLPNGNDIADCLATTVITFNAGGKVTGKAGSECTTSTDMNPVDDNSTWKLDGTKLTLTSGTDVTTYDTVLSGNTLKMSTQEMEDFDGDGKKENYTITLELTKA